MKMNTVTRREAQPGDEAQISSCMLGAAELSEMTDGSPESIAEWYQICSTKELLERIHSGDKTLVALCDEVVVGFIAFRRGSHLSLLFVHKEYAGRGIGRELFHRSAAGLDEITVNSSDGGVGFYQKVGFTQNGERVFLRGAWVTPMKWVRAAFRQVDE